MEDLGSFPWLGRFPGEGNSYCGITFFNRITVLQGRYHLFLFKNVDIRNQRGLAICHTTSVWESLDSNLLLFTFFCLEEPTSPPLGPLFSDPMVSSVFLGLPDSASALFPKPIAPHTHLAALETAEGTQPLL